MEFAWLEDFVALVTSGQFSSAAENRHISQSGFSRRIKSLEDWVGTPLFVRDTKGVRLTAAGEQFRPFAEDALRKIVQAREQALEAIRIERGALAFASTHALSLTFFPTWLRQLNSAASLSATVRLVADNMAACERLMLQGQVQFLLCHHHPAAETVLEDRHFRSVKLGTDVLAPVCVPNPNDPSEPRFPVSKVTDQFPYLAYSHESGMGRILSATIPAIANKPSSDVQFTSHVAAVLYAMTKDGAGVAWLPMSLIGDDLAARRLVFAASDAMHVPVDIVLIRPRSRQSAAGEAFWKLVLDHGQASSAGSAQLA
ncbi:MAG: LysR family transcriptional regulator [Ensifer sp. SSB1]|nr:LysR family transcriptional regulator [Ensifer sp. SSB1]